MGLFEKNDDKKEKRFVVKEGQFTPYGALRVIVDTVTGVNYLWSPESGITPLLDKNGSVVIDDISGISEN